MPRKTTISSLSKLSCGDEKKDKIARAILYKISTNELMVERQAVYDDLDHMNEEFFGEYGDLGITIRYAKRKTGIAGRKYLVIESERETLEIGGPIGAKAWNLAETQERQFERVEERSVSDESLDDIAAQLGI